MDRECEAQDARGTAGRGGAACHSRTRGAPAGHESQVRELLLPELLHNRAPRAVELGGRRRGAPAGHQVRLLDQCHGEACFARAARGGREVGGADPPPAP